MAIPDEDIAKVREATDISALIGEYTSLKRVGLRFVGLCPFHSEKSPSFSVNAEQGLYYCFGCQVSGDAISFIRAIEHCDFVEAVERLAGRAGITVRNDTDGVNDAARGKRQALYGALEAAAEFYHRQLLESPAAGAARRYLRSRGYDGEVVRQFKLGFAPTGYDALMRSLKIAPGVLKESGLGFENARGKMQDVMRERVIFPIFDPLGKAIALGGRVMPDELRSNTQNPGPKYRNSPESPIYSKSSTLYGLNWSKNEVARTHEVIVCEGYTDVIGFSTAGLPRAVATCGTSLTENHFKLLSRFAKRVVLCFDQDNAGQNAAARLYEFERRHEVELCVAALPPGSDPGELARTDPETLRNAITSARPFLGFRVDRSLAQFDPATPEGRTRAAEAAIAVIAEHPNDLVRDQYIIEVADRTHHDPHRLREMLEAERIAPRDRPVPPSARTRERLQNEQPQGDRPIPNAPDDEEGPGPAVIPARVSANESRAGRDALMLAIHRPGEVADWIDEVLFRDQVQRSAFLALCEAEELHQAIDQADPDAGELLRRLVVSDGSEDIDVMGTMIELVRTATTRALLQLEGEARLRADEPNALRETSEMSGWLKAELEQLRDPSESSPLATRASESALRLLAWLRETDSSPDA
jgi:DNA primase